MVTYEPSAGERIGHACVEAVRIAKTNLQPCVFTFNGIELVADVDSSPSRLIESWRGQLEQRQAEYRNSPEGIQAAANRAAAIVKKQAALDATVAALPKILRTDNHLDAVVRWIKELIDPADDVATKWNPQEVADQLEAAGYVENEHVGQKPEWFNARERMGRYVIGQAISAMRLGMPPHPVAYKFIDEYFRLSRAALRNTTH